MSSDEASRRGRSNNARGQAWQREGARLLRESGIFPHAEHCGQMAYGRPGIGGSGDLRNVGDRVIEMTLEPWDNVNRKLTQAAEAASQSGVDRWVVWKRMPRQDYGSVIVQPWEQWWNDAANLDRLEQEDASAGEAFNRGYNTGYEAGLARGREQGKVAS